MDAKKIYDFTAAHFAKVVDNLGLVKAEIAELKKKEKALEKVLKASGLTAVDGDFYRATVSAYTRTSVDYKGIALKLKASNYMLKAYSKISNVVKVAVKAHKK